MNKVDRLAIVVSIGKIGHILSIPALDDGHSSTQASVIAEVNKVHYYMRLWIFDSKKYPLSNINLQ